MHTKKKKKKKKYCANPEKIVWWTDRAEFKGTSGKTGGPKKYPKKKYLE